MSTRTLAVIGAGTSGLQGLCHYLAFLGSHGWHITLIHSPKINILGIGESTNPTFVESLEQGVNFNIIDDLADIDGTFKIGTRYTNWRTKELTIPILSGNAAIHVNTFKVQNFILPRLQNIWGDRFKIIQGHVDNLTNLDDKASVTVDGSEYYFDYVIDNRGFPESYNEYHTILDNPVNHALVHNKKELVNWNYTLHQATFDGWMFGVPLTSRTSYGYLFNDSITSVETAKENFSKEIGVPINDLDSIEYKFKSYYANNIVQGRIIKNGNRAVFFEPMFANSLWLYKNIDKLSISYINQAFTEEKTNHIFRLMAKAVEELICFFYHGGSVYDTEFWNYTKKYAADKLSTSENFKTAREVLLRQYKNKFYDPNINEFSWVFSEKHLFNIDEKFGYNYFKTDE